MSRVRIAVAALSLSAVGFISLVSGEGFVDKAMVPTKGDRPTVGFGSTFQADGSPVKMGDTTTPVRALVTAEAHINKQEELFRQSLTGASLSQVEFDVYMDFVYQYGTANWSSSSMRRELLAGNYQAACDALLQWKRAAGYDCSTPGNKRCWGVWERQLARHQKCVGAL
jgi:GH24 family phage-related lysozyme (muramidase)